MAATDVATLFLESGACGSNASRRGSRTSSTSGPAICDRPIGDLHAHPRLRDARGRCAARAGDPRADRATRHQPRRSPLRRSNEPVSHRQRPRRRRRRDLHRRHRDQAGRGRRSRQRTRLPRSSTSSAVCTLMTMAVATASTVRDALSNVLTSAMSLLGADCGRVQLFDRDARRLRATMQQGFERAGIEYVEQIDARENSPCAVALRTRTTNEVGDVLNDPQGSASMRDLIARAGYRAIQCTPLCSREGDLVGMVSVYYREPHPFSEREKRLAKWSASRPPISSRCAPAGRADAVERRTAGAHRGPRSEPGGAAQPGQSPRGVPREPGPRTAKPHLRDPERPVAAPTGDGSTAIEKGAGGVAAPDGAHDETDRRSARHHAGQTREDSPRASDARPQRVAAPRASRTRGRRPRPKGWRSKATSRRTDPVDADPERLAQILENLLRNAVTNTKAGSVRVAVQANGDEARITVHDTGAGIEPNDV